MDRCRSLHFKGHPCGYSVLGSEQSIDDLTSRQMRDYFELRYAPNNMVAACAGNFDWDKFCRIIEELCSDWNQQSVTRQLTHYGGSKQKERLVKANL
jgi:predicted Zn-dependent peptidase